MTRRPNRHRALVERVTDVSTALACGALGLWVSVQASPLALPSLVACAVSVSLLLMMGSGKPGPFKVTMQAQSLLNSLARAYRGQRGKPAAPTPAATASAWSPQVIAGLDRDRFDLLCQALWKARGYNARLLCTCADSSALVRIFESTDPLQLFAVAQSRTYAAAPVDVGMARELWTALHHVGAKRGMLYSMSGFTADAIEFAQGQHLELVSVAELLRQICGLPEEKAEALLRDALAG